MSSVYRPRRVLLGTAVVASVVACLATIFAGSALAAVFAGAPAILVLATLTVEYRRDSSTSDALIGKLAEQAEAGRKLVIYERETGLFAHWYITLRGEEECNRAARYERPLTLLVIEPAPESNVWAVQGSLAHWLKQHLRAVDVPGYLGNGRYVVLMPETDVKAAQNMVARLRREIDQAETGLSGFPEDAVTFQQLYAIARDRVGEAVERAA